MKVEEKIDKAAIAGSDLVYIDEFGLVKTISAITLMPPLQDDI